MTRAPRHRRLRPRAVISRLLVVLAFLLSGGPQGPVDGVVAQAGPVAQSLSEQAQGILTGQRHLLRAHLPQDDTPETATPGEPAEPRQPVVAATLSPAAHPSLLAVAIRILPPVRGPPVV